MTMSLAAALLFMVAAAQAQPIHVDAQVDKKRISLGDPFTLTISIEFSAAIVHCSVSACPIESGGISLSLFRARWSSPAPLSNISNPASSRNGTWPKGWRARWLVSRPSKGMVRTA